MSGRPAVAVGPVQQGGRQRQRSAGVGGHVGVGLRQVAQEETQRVHVSGAHGGVESRAAVLRRG